MIQSGLALDKSAANAPVILDQWSSFDAAAGIRKEARQRTTSRRRTNPRR